VQERHLPVQKLCEQDIGALSEVRQDRENEASLRVTPPGVAKGLTREKGDDVRQFLVLRKQQATIRKDVKDLLRRPQDQARAGHIGVNRSLTARLLAFRAGKPIVTLAQEPIHPPEHERCARQRRLLPCFRHELA